jgi:GH15 family glucan-1,4-alpha-glucosidase
MYTLDGGRDLPEHERRFHLDVYGHIVLAASEQLLNGGDIPERALNSLYSIADYLCQAWRRPDHGASQENGEAPGKPEHFVSSKVMSWIAIDRVIKIATAKSRDIPPRWRQEREILHRTILENGYDENIGSFVRTFSDREIDASLLVIPLTGFLPPDDPRVLGTLTAIQERLGQGALILRGTGPDSAHLPSSFGFASCLALCGRADEAGDRLAELCSYATPLGFFGDQVDVAGETSGSFPSAVGHVALINASVYVGQARGLRLPPILSHVIGTPEAAPPTASAARRRLRPLRRAG